MDWEKSSSELVDWFDSIAPQHPNVTRQKMFGWPCCFVNGNLFAGLHKQSVIFRLSGPHLEAFLELDGAAEFEPMPGRKMKGYGILSHPLGRDRTELSRWMGRALEHTAALPAKGQGKTPAPSPKRRPGGNRRAVPANGVFGPPSKSP